MTTILDRTSGPATAAPIRPNTFLHRAWWADAIVSGVVGLAMVVGAGLIGRSTGLMPGLLVAVGLSFAPYVAFLAWLATRPTVPVAAAWAPVVLNIGWAAACAGFLAAGGRPTAEAAGFVALHIVAVLGFAELEFVGLRRSSAGG